MRRYVNEIDKCIIGKIMVNYFKAKVLLVFSVVLFLITNTLNAKEPELESLMILRSEGDELTYQIEVARTPVQMMRGLMFRDSMPENQGMLFIYSPERPATMWMKNTILSLDMLFIDGKGIIVNIARDTVPFSLDRIPSGQPVKGVLELNAGQADKQGIRIGDKVNHPEFE